MVLDVRVAGVGSMVMLQTWSKTAQARKKATTES
jgi:hypothetical protein